MLINSVSELHLALMSETEKIFKKSEKDLINEIKDSIDEVVYDSYDPIRYNRSGDLKNTLVANTQNTTLIVSHDINKASWFSVKDGKKFKDVPDVVVGQKKYGTFKGYGIDAHGGDYHDIEPTSWKAWARPRDYMQHAENKIIANGYAFIRKHLPTNVTITND
jgi:hypothetical protein